MPLIKAKHTVKLANYSVHTSAQKKEKVLFCLSVCWPKSQFMVFYPHNFVSFSVGLFFSPFRWFIQVNYAKIVYLLRFFSEVIHFVLLKNKGFN